MIFLLRQTRNPWFRKAHPAAVSRQPEGRGYRESRSAEQQTSRTSIFRRPAGCGFLAALLMLTALLGGCNSGEEQDQVRHLVSAQAGDGGKISPDSQQVRDGRVAAFTVTAAIGYSIEEVTGCNGTLNGSTYTTGAIIDACMVTATFSQNRYQVTTAAGAGGKISPSSQDVLHGGKTQFTVTVDAGHRLEKIGGCGGGLLDITYHTGIITEKCEVRAHFVPLTAPAAEIIIDNEPGPLGKWEPSDAPNPYGAGSLQSREAKASYTFTAQASGTYDLYLWWTQAPDRSTDVPVEIHDATGLIAKVSVDQQRNGGRWNRLGTFIFSEEARIVIISPGTTSACADAVRLIRIDDGGPRVTLTSPAGRHLQTSPDLTARADGLFLQKGWGVRFLLDAGAQSLDDYQPPYEATFKGVPVGEHVIDAMAIDEQGREVPDAGRSRVTQIGIGRYLVAMGDSITWGAGDDLLSDNHSLDGRDGPRGFEPVLNDLLTAARKLPHRIASEGVGGNRAEDGIYSIHGLLGKHPEAQVFLVLYGTNDSFQAWNPVPSGRGLLPADSGYHGTYKDHMQQIIEAAFGAGKKVNLAKVPIALGDSSQGSKFADPQTARRNQLIREYNEVIDELVKANGIAVSPPDLYAYFTEKNPATGKYRYEEEYADNVHFNGQGYRSMARLWKEALAAASAGQ
jgi:lysophospholipase L1-like esterase